MAGLTAVANRAVQAAPMSEHGSSLLIGCIPERLGNRANCPQMPVWLLPNRGSTAGLRCWRRFCASWAAIRRCCRCAALRRWTVSRCRWCICDPTVGAPAVWGGSAGVDDGHDAGQPPRHGA